MNDPALALWGGIECTVSRNRDHYSDQLAQARHFTRTGDLDLVAGLGITSLRYPVLWEHVAAHGFGDADAGLARLRALGIRPIVGLIHHGSGPAHTSLLDDGFVTGLAAHAAATAARFPWVDDWTPVNEPLTTARFSCLYGYWYPHLRDEGATWRALLTQIEATIAAMAAIRAVNPAARLIQTDDLGEARATPPMAVQAAFENDRRWLSWDLLAGRVVPGHPLHDRIAGHGLGDRLARIAAAPCPADVIGINHYLLSDRFLSHEFARHPEKTPAADGIPCLNLDAVRAVDGAADVGALLRTAAARYDRPVAITECHNAAPREEQMRWFAEVWQAAAAARAAGVPVVAVTAWSLFGAYDWNSLLTRRDGHYEVGVFDLRSDPPRATAMTRLLPALATGSTPPLADIVAAPGWWRRDDRFLAGYGGAGRTPPPRGRPIVITGGTGTLGQALARACRRRHLACVLTTRERLAIDDAASVAAALAALEPWAVINCAGVVSIDRAEADPALADRVNAAGPELLAAACARHGVRFVQLSSDQVFDGGKGTPYVESDATAARNAYGRSKAAAEARVLAVWPRALVARTAAFFSPDDRHNFAVQTVAALRAGQRVVAAGDEIVSPTYVPDLVETLLDLLIDDASGIWHLANVGGVSWAGFGRALAAASGCDPALIETRTGVLPGSAPRPRDVRLASARGTLLPTLESAIARFAACHAVEPSRAAA